MSWVNCWDTILLNEFWKFVHKRAFGELNIFQDQFKKKYNNNQRMSGSFYHITESSELNWEIGVEIYSFGHVDQPCFRILRRKTYVGLLCFDQWRHEILSHTCVRQKEFVVASLDWKQGLLCDKIIYKTAFNAISRIFSNDTGANKRWSSDKPFPSKEGNIVPQITRETQNITFIYAINLSREDTIH